MIKRVIFGANKGGVSKTTSTLGVALILALRGKKVLILDADPEGNMSSLLSDSYNRWHNHRKELSMPMTLMYALGIGNLNKAVVKVMKNLYLIPSSMDFSNYPDFLLKRYFHKTSSPFETKLKYVSYLSKMMQPVEQKLKPDYVFCDIPPSGDLFEKSCLYYIGSNSKELGYLFLMMETQEHSYEGVQYFNDFAGKLIPEYHLNYQVAGVLPVLLKKQSPSDNSILAKAKKNYGQSMLLKPIPNRERIKRYAISGVSIPGVGYRTQYDRDVTKIYSQITDEVLQHMRKVDQGE